MTFREAPASLEAPSPVQHALPATTCGFCPNHVEVCYNHSMVTINIDDMQRDLVGYLHRVRAGETLLVPEADQPLAEIKP